MMVPFWFALKLLGFLRVPAEEQTLGLDGSYTLRICPAASTHSLSDQQFLLQAGCWA